MAALPLVDTQTSLTGAYAAATGCLQSFYNNRQGTIAPTVSHPDVGYSPDTNFFDPDNVITLSFCQKNLQTTQAVGTDEATGWL